MVMVMVMAVMLGMENPPEAAVEVPSATDERIRTMVVSIMERRDILKTFSCQFQYFQEYM
jgi:hypothetical protein